MEQERIRIQTRSVTLNVTGSQVDSYRSQEETKHTARVYADGKIGVAGALGESDEAALIAQATAALENGIPYPCALGNAAGEERHDTPVLTEAEFLPRMQQLLNRLSAECPKFAISNKITLSDFRTDYCNSKGASLSASSAWLDLSLLFQSKGSGNLMDAFYGASVRQYDEDAVVRDCKAMHDAFYRDVSLEAGEYPVFFAPADVLGTMLNHFIGPMYVSGASLLSGKLGQTVANPNLTVAVDRNPATCLGAAFFDAEGEIAPDYRQPLIENGVFRHVLASKGMAEMIQLPASATAGAEYDGVPSLAVPGIWVRPTARHAAELAPGKAILLCMASGGDMTPDGHYATPVQLAFLVENGEIVGRLPELNVASDFSSLLGDGYLGTVENAFFPSMQQAFMACRMQVTL